MAKKPKSPKPADPILNKRKVGPAPTVISANLKTMKRSNKELAAQREARMRDARDRAAPKEKKERLGIRGEATRNAQAGKSSSDTPMKDSGAKEKSALAVFMGKCFKSLARPTVKLQHPQAIKMTEALGLNQRHLRIMRDQFDDIDVDGSGNIDAVELFEAMGEVRSKITEELFAMMDMDGNARLDFDEYVAVALSYCMYTKDDILKFCFDLFDLDSGGTIDEKEFTEMCVAVSAGDPLFSGNFRMALENFDTNDDGLIDFDEFRNLNDRYPMILHPAFRMQDKLQKYTLGEEEWVKVMENINYWQKIKEYTDKEGEAPPSSRWERFREKYLRRCFGHAPVDLEYIASQSKMEQAKRAAAEEARLKAGG